MVYNKHMFAIRQMHGTVYDPAWCGTNGGCMWYYSSPQTVVTVITHILSNTLTDQLPKARLVADHSSSTTHNPPSIHLTCFTASSRRSNKFWRTATSALCSSIILQTPKSGDSAHIMVTWPGLLFRILSSFSVYCFRYSTTTWRPINREALLAGYGGSCN